MRRVITLIVAFVVALSPVALGISSSENVEPEHLTYTVFSRQVCNTSPCDDRVGPIHVAALKWVPKGATTVLLAVHGSEGVKENNWGPLSVHGYSFAHRRYKEGRATVAIDLPGYGESEGDNPDRDLAAVDDYAWVVDQIADELHKEFRKVVGVGHSIGGLIVEVAQGIFRSFDAIIPAGWSHAGYSNQDRNNCTAGNPCLGVRDILFWRPNADPQVVEDFVAPLESFSDLEAIDIGVWGGFWTRPPVGIAPDEVSHLIDVPVLVFLGKKDFFWNPTTEAEERSHFLPTANVTVLLLENTGHAVFHHLNHDFVEDTVGDWLRARGF